MAEAPRIPFAQTISTRDSTMNYDAILYNYYASKNTNGQMIVDRRFGVQISSSVTAGAGLGMFAFGVNLLTIVGTTFYVNGVSKGTVNAGSLYQFTLIGEGGTGVFLKNNKNAYVWNGSTLTPVQNSSTQVLYSVTMTAVGSGYTSVPAVVITPANGATAVATVTGGQVTAVTVTNPGSGFTSAPAITFTGGGGSGAAATAVILAGWYPPVTVPGVAYIDGYVVVEDPTGLIWNSNLNTPLIGNPLNFIVGSSFSDPGAALTRLYAYVVSFGTYSCSFFYDAGNTPPGSPFLPNIAAQAAVGCAIGTSVVATENTIFWIGQTHQKGRRVYMMNGLIPQAVSDQFIDRVLNADPLTGVYAYYIEINGHAFYVLTLIASNLTLVYDSTTGMWSRWSSTALGNRLTVVVASLRNGVLTLTIPNHELQNGAVVMVSSPNSSSNYLGTVVPVIIDANTISYSVNALVTGGINENTINTFTINDESIRFGTNTGLGQLYVTPYVQNAFSPSFYAYANNTDFLLDKSTGSTYNMQQGVSNDNGTFIYGLLRTNAGDFGSNKMKFFPSIDIIADKVSDTAYIGYSDDDYQSFSIFRPVNLASDRSMVKRCAASRRRAFSLLYIGGFQCRFYNIELLDMVEGPL
jgi:hypothetical protein